MIPKVVALNWTIGKDLSINITNNKTTSLTQRTLAILICQFIDFFR